MRSWMWDTTFAMQIAAMHPGFLEASEVDAGND